MLDNLFGSINTAISDIQTAATNYYQAQQAIAAAKPQGSANLAPVYAQQTAYAPAATAAQAAQAAGGNAAAGGKWVMVGVAALAGVVLWKLLK